MKKCCPGAWLFLIGAYSITKDGAIDTDDSSVANPYTGHLSALRRGTYEGTMLLKMGHLDDERPTGEWPRGVSRLLLSATPGSRSSSGRARIGSLRP